jgi:hypothetical protein
MRLGLGLGLNRIALGGGGGVTLTIDALTFTAGDPATLEIDVTYTGEAALTAYAVTGVDPVSGDAEGDYIVNGSGGTNTLEFFNFGVTPPNDTDDITGLTSYSNSADRILVVIEDANGVRSAVAEVTVSGLSFGITKTYLGEFSTLGAGSPTGEYTFTGITHGTGTMYAVVTTKDEGVVGGGQPTTVTLAGQSASIVTDGVTTAENTPGSHISASAWSASVTAGTSSVTFDCGSDLGDGIAARLYLIEGAHTVQEVVAPTPATSPVGASLDTTTGGIVLLAGQTRAAAGSKVFTPTGVTQDGTTIDLDSGDVSVAASAEVTTGEAPRTVSVDISGGGSQVTVVAVSLTPGS